MLIKKKKKAPKEQFTSQDFPDKQYQKNQNIDTNMCVRVCAQSHWLFAIPWTVACEAPLSMGFPSKNTGVGCHFLLQGIFPTQGLNSHLLCLLHWQVDYWPLTLLGSPNTNIDISKEIYCEGLAHVNMEAEKFHNLLLASGALESQWCSSSVSWKAWEAGESVVQILVWNWRLRTKSTDAPGQGKMEDPDQAKCKPFFPLFVLWRPLRDWMMPLASVWWSSLSAPVIPPKVL